MRFSSQSVSGSAQVSGWHPGLGLKRSSGIQMPDLPYKRDKGESSLSMPPHWIETSIEGQDGTAAPGREKVCGGVQAVP